MPNFLQQRRGGVDKTSSYVAKTSSLATTILNQVNRRRAPAEKANNYSSDRHVISFDRSKSELTLKDKGSGEVLLKSRYDLQQKKWRGNATPGLNSEAIIQLEESLKQIVGTPEFQPASANLGKDKFEKLSPDKIASAADFDPRNTSKPTQAGDRSL